MVKQVKINNNSYKNFFHDNYNINNLDNSS